MKTTVLPCQVIWIRVVTWAVAVLATLAVGAVTANAQGSTLHVPLDFPTIQSAIDAAIDGDVVLVAPDSENGGPYFENIDFRGKPIIVRSSDGPESTTIDGSRPANERRASVVRFTNGEDERAQIEGFTITGGVGTRIGSHQVGGGIFVEGASPVIRGNRVAENSAGIATHIAAGAGIFCRFSSATILDNVIDGNFLYDTRGGGIFGYRSDLTIRGNFIARCMSTWSPGASGITLEQSTGIISQNELTQITGRAIEAWQDVVIEDNYVHLTAGGIWANERCLVRRNVVERTGGPNAGIICGEQTIVDGNRLVDNSGWFSAGISCSFATARITNNLIVDNRSSRGGGITCRGSSPLILNNTIVGNKVRLRGGGIFCYEGASPVIVNNIVWGNSSNLDQSQIDLKNADATVSYCVVQGGFPGEGNIDLPPEFVAPDRGDYRLRIESPCVDAGSPDASELPGEDFEGDPRVADGDRDGTARVDIGADEMRISVAVRFGSVRASGEDIEDVLFVNGSTGGRRRVVRVATDRPIVVTVEAPRGGPRIAPFALYAWVGEPTDESVVQLPEGVGYLGFSSPIAGTGLQPHDIWNNIGRYQKLGSPNHPSDPAPSTPIELPHGVGRSGTITLQGIIVDRESAASRRCSVTNAVVLDVRE